MWFYTCALLAAASVWSVEGACVNQALVNETLTNCTDSITTLLDAAEPDCAAVNSTLLSCITLDVEACDNEELVNMTQTLQQTVLDACGGTDGSDDSEEGDCDFNAVVVECLNVDPDDQDPDIGTFCEALDSEDDPVDDCLADAMAACSSEVEIQIDLYVEALGLLCGSGNVKVEMTVVILSVVSCLFAMIN